MLAWEKLEYIDKPRKLRDLWIKIKLRWHHAGIAGKLKSRGILNLKASVSISLQDAFAQVVTTKQTRNSSRYYLCPFSPLISAFSDNDDELPWSHYGVESNWQLQMLYFNSIMEFLESRGMLQKLREVFSQFLPFSRQYDTSLCDSCQCFYYPPHILVS